MDQTRVKSIERSIYSLLKEFGVQTNSRKNNLIFTCRTLPIDRAKRNVPAYVGMKILLKEYTCLINGHRRSEDLSDRLPEEFIPNYKCRSCGKFYS